MNSGRFWPRDENGKHCVSHFAYGRSRTCWRRHAPESPSSRPALPVSDRRFLRSNAMNAIKYIHHTPGRLRVKGSHFQCRGDQARKAVAALHALSGVESVRLNAHASSLTVHYDPDRHNQAELLAVLERAGCFHGAVEIHTPVRHADPKEGVAGTFGKALVGVLAQRTATRLLGVLL